MLLQRKTFELPASSSCSSTSERNSSKVSPESLVALARLLAHSLPLSCPVDTSSTHLQLVLLPGPHSLTLSAEYQWVSSSSVQDDSSSVEFSVKKHFLWVDGVGEKAADGRISNVIIISCR